MIIHKENINVFTVSIFCEIIKLCYTSISYCFSGTNLFYWHYDIEPRATNAIDNIAKVPYKPPSKAFNADFCLAPLLNPFK